LLNGEADKAVGMHCGKMHTVDFATAIKKKEINVDEWYSLIKSLS